MDGEREKRESDALFLNILGVVVGTIAMSLHIYWVLPIAVFLFVSSIHEAIFTGPRQ